MLDDDRNTYGRETAVSDGVRLSLSFGDAMIETERLRWAGWDEAPATIERAKPSLELFAEAVHELPGELESPRLEDRPEIGEAWE